MVRSGSGVRPCARFLAVLLAACAAAACEKEPPAGSAPAVPPETDTPGESGALVEINGTRLFALI